MWVTHPKKPRELSNDKEQTSMAQISLQTLRNLTGWKLHLWTNDKKLLPKTVEWAEKEAGLTVRELKELNIFKDYEDLFLHMLDLNVVMASDLSRFLILYELGGMYLDIDQVLYEFDERLLAFDFFGYTTDLFSFGRFIAETSFMASVPGLPLFEEYFRQARSYAAQG